MDTSNLTAIEVDGVDSSDYPDFCDAYISYAKWEDTGMELTDDELDFLNTNHPELAQEYAFDHILGMADFALDRMKEKEAGF